MKLHYIYYFSILALFACCTFNSSAQSALYLSNGVNLSLGSSASITVVGNLKTEDNGDAATITNEGQLNIEGNWLNEGSGNLLDNSTGTVSFNGNPAQNIEGNTEFYNLEIDNGNGVTINSGVNEVTNQLDLTSGLFATNDSLTLVSTVSKTARIAPISVGSISGDVIIQAFIESANYDYRFLSMPVQSKTLSEWSDDFLTSGFIGSDYPAFSFVNLYFYNETLIGSRNLRYLPATNITNPVAMGQGIQTYIGAADILVDVKGEIYSGTLDLPVSFTDDVTQPIEEDGWNLVGNPYASTIDWDSPNWTKAGLNDAIYIYEGSSGVYRTYINGVGANGGNQYIPSSQSFWVKAISSPLLRITENVKTAENTGFIERRLPPDVLRLRLSNDSTNQDEIVVRYNSSASSNFDNHWDALKLKGSGQPLTLTAIHDSIDYSILSLNEDSVAEEVIYLQTEVSATGMYTLNVDQIPTQANCIFIEDLFTGRVENLRDSNRFHFILSDTTKMARFKLTSSPLINYQVIQPKCHGGPTVITTDSGYSGSVFLKWVDDSGVRTFTDSNFTNTNIVLTDATYYFEVNHADCSAQLDTFVIQSPNAISMQVNTLLDSNNNLSNAWVVASGGVAPYQFNWTSLGQNQNDSVFALTNGIYPVVVTDANGCVDSTSVVINNISVGLKNVVTSEYRVYPNPASDFIQIEGMDLSSLSYELYAVNGQLVKAGKFSFTESRIKITQLNSGIYFLKLYSGESTEVIKIKKIK